jgi:hypothetical protein
VDRVDTIEAPKHRNKLHWPHLSPVFYIQARVLARARTGDVSGSALDIGDGAGATMDARDSTSLAGPVRCCDPHYGPGIFSLSHIQSRSDTEVIQRQWTACLAQSG